MCMIKLTRFWLLPFTLAVFASACQLLQQKKSTVVPPQTPIVSEKRPVYHAARTLKQDLVHTVLDLRFNWQSKEVYGKATLTLKPYFYATKTLELDAKGMIIKEVSLLDSLGNKKKLTYKYNDKTIAIQLDKEYKRTESYKIFIDYTAQPEKLLEKKLIAEDKEKGLFFVYADGNNPHKPKQIWSQGEAESSSCWFPTIEATAEKMTQEVYITVDNQFQTLSNGLLKSSTKNSDGTRTDYWKQDLPHSTYLVMVAVGEFAVIKSQWNKIVLEYYVEHKDSADALAVFGNTPEMLTFFSQKLGVPYPWEKYSQMIVREFHWGAMENTSAVIHAPYVMRSKKELLDEDHEDVIAHELFHHWFGDLVTCESWANLPLNESFATLGECLWIDHKYGKDEGDYHRLLDLQAYLDEAQSKKERLVRYNYSFIDDMFDRHSYQKGSLVLHMLRNYVGEEAFFAAVQDYLESNKFKSTEMAQLRMSFEKITGEDLNWFFNQWFFTKGHPMLDIAYRYDKVSDSISVVVEQTQPLLESSVYRFPIDIDVYSGGKPKRSRVWMTNKCDTFRVIANGEPEWVSIDADKVLLCEKNERKSTSEWLTQFEKSKNIIDRYDAFEHVLADTTPKRIKDDFLVTALNDKFWAIKLMALDHLSADTTLSDSLLTDVMDKTFKLAVKDPKSHVRAAAIRFIRKNYSFEEAEPVLKKTFNDSSNYVVASTIRAYSNYKKEEAYDIIKQKEQPYAEWVSLTLGDIYKSYKNKEEIYSFYTNAIAHYEGARQAQLVEHFGMYLVKQKKEIFFKGLDSLYNIATSDDDVEVRKEAVLAMVGLRGYYDARMADLQRDINDNKDTKKGSFDAKQMQEKLDKLKEERKKIEDKINLAIAKEKDKELAQFYKNVLQPVKSE